MLFEWQSFLHKTATLQPINTFSIQNRRFQYHCTPINYPSLFTKALEIQPLFMFQQLFTKLYFFKTAYLDGI